MDKAASNYYINELFVFEPDNKHFYAHEEFLYQFGVSPEPITVSLSPSYFNMLKQIVVEEPVNRDEPIILQTYNFKPEPQGEEPEESVLSNVPQELPSEAQNQGEFQKENFDLFLEVVDLSTYTHQMSLQEFFCEYYVWIGKNEHKLSAYFYFRKKGYEIESGCIFSFDFLLYKERGQEVGLLNKVDRTHSDFAVYLVCEDAGTKITFKDVHRKDRIAHNYNKVTYYSKPIGLICCRSSLYVHFRRRVNIH